ncbi:hypothetical protein CSAL01_08351 [Colletotrichum salicis]|uniref:Uncharacterized protein n=1 Tax=Colletotrichum salicis TaxID=1209931 RepID=A0A135UMD4_9PEZI|nr:hypothetical protein CSAL01_08351 [Colletotrichum salicis]
MTLPRLFRSLQRHLPRAIPRPTSLTTTTSLTITTSLTATAFPQTRLFSNTSPLRGKVVHPDMDDYIRYSLRDGPPRTPRPKPLYSLFRQHSWPNTPPAPAPATTTTTTTKTPLTLTTPTFISAFQPTLRNRRVSSSSRTPEDLAQIESSLRQLKNLNSQVDALSVLADDLNDRVGAYSKLMEKPPRFRGELLPWCREVLSRFREDRRLQSQRDAVNVLQEPSNT